MLNKYLIIILICNINVSKLYYLNIKYYFIDKIKKKLEAEKKMQEFEIEEAIASYSSPIQS